MFSSLKKKDDEYKQNKISYPILGLILGSTIGYYAPFVFLFTKFLSVTAIGGIGGYTAKYFNEKELEECHYKKCAFDRYNEYNERFIIKDYLFRKHMMNKNNFDINYSYRNLLNNIEDNDHILSKCYNDMIEHFKLNYENDLDKHLQKFLNFYFYHLCQYYIQLKDMNVTKKQIEMDEISSWGEYKNIDNKLLKIFEIDNEVFLKLYISIEKIILDSVDNNIRMIIYEKYKKEDKKIMDNRKRILEEKCLEIDNTEIQRLWLDFIESVTPYEKLSIFYEINIKISEEVFKLTGKNAGADEIFPILINSILLTGCQNLYSEYMYLKITYNYDIYNNIFEFLIIKFSSIIEYLIK